MPDFVQKCSKFNLIPDGCKNDVNKVLVNNATSPPSFFYDLSRCSILFPGPSPLSKWRSGWVAYDKIAFSEVISSNWQPCLFSGNPKSFSKRNEDISSCFVQQNTPGFLEYHFGTLFRGFFARHFAANLHRLRGLRVNPKFEPACRLEKVYPL